MLYTLRFFSLQNAVCFIMLTCLVSVLLTFYIQGVLKLKKNNSGAKGLIIKTTDDDISPSLHNRIDLINTDTFSDENLMMAGLGRNM